MSHVSRLSQNLAFDFRYKKNLKKKKIPHARITFEKPKDQNRKIFFNSPNENIKLHSVHLASLLVYQVLMVEQVNYVSKMEGDQHLAVNQKSSFPPLQIPTTPILSLEVPTMTFPPLQVPTTPISSLKVPTTLFPPLRVLTTPIPQVRTKISRLQSLKIWRSSLRHPMT